MKNEMKQAKNAPGTVHGQIRNPAEATPCEGSAASPQPTAEQEQYDECDEYEIDAFDDAFERRMWLMEEHWTRWGNLPASTPPARRSRPPRR